LKDGDGIPVLRGSHGRI